MGKLVQLDPLPTEALPTCLFCKSIVIVWRESPTVCCKTTSKTIEVDEAAVCTNAACGKVAVPLSPAANKKELFYGSAEAIAVDGPTHLVVQGRRPIRPASISLVIKTSTQQTVLT